MKFAKPSVSIKEQIDRLRHCGMVVCDDAAAKHCLEFVSYHLLGAC